MWEFYIFKNIEDLGCMWNWNFLRSVVENNRVFYGYKVDWCVWGGGGIILVVSNLCLVFGCYLVFFLLKLNEDYF